MVTRAEWFHEVAETKPSECGSMGAAVKPAVPQHTVQIGGVTGKPHDCHIGLILQGLSECQRTGNPELKAPVLFYNHGVWAWFWDLALLLCPVAFLALVVIQGPAGAGPSSGQAVLTLSSA